MILNEEVFLTLVRLGIGNTREVSSLPKYLDWTELADLMLRHGLTAIIVDGIEKLSDDQRPPKELLLQWIGETIQGYEFRYEQYKKAISELAGFYNTHGYKMMVIKGYACCLDWPRPEHRPCGDIDVWLFGHNKDADVLLAHEKGIGIDRGHHHHTIFEWEGFLIENHYDFLNIHQHKSNILLENSVKELAKDDTHFTVIYGEKVYLPSANLHALFLLRHAMTHFTSSEINVRQLLDWAFFAKAHSREIDWKWLMGVMNEYGMTKMFNIINAICVEDLGFEVSSFPTARFEPWLKERVLKDILSPEFSMKEPNIFFCRALFKYKRWRKNRWKHEICFNDSLWSAFWTGFWGHLLKPKSI